MITTLRSLRVDMRELAQHSLNRTFSDGQCFGELKTRIEKKTLYSTSSNTITTGGRSFLWQVCFCLFPCSILFCFIFYFSFTLYFSLALHDNIVNQFLQCTSLINILPVSANCVVSCQFVFFYKAVHNFNNICQKHLQKIVCVSILHCVCTPLHSSIITDFCPPSLLTYFQATLFL